MWELCWIFLSSVFRFCKIKGYYYWKYKFYRLSIRNPASGLLQIGCKLKKWQWRHNFRRDVFVSFLDVILFLSGLVTSPSFMSISSLVLELWQFLFIRDWPEIWKSEIPFLSFAQYLETVSNKMLLDAAKCQGQRLPFLSHLGKTNWGGSKFTPPRLGLMSKNLAFGVC